MVDVFDLIVLAAWYYDDDEEDLNRDLKNS